MVAPVFSPDGKKFVYATRSPNRDYYELQLLNTKTGRIESLIAIREVFSNKAMVIFSADSESLVLITHGVIGSTYMWRGDDEFAISFEVASLTLPRRQDCCLEETGTILFDVKIFDVGIELPHIRHPGWVYIIDLKSGTHHKAKVDSSILNSRIRRAYQGNCRVDYQTLATSPSNDGGCISMLSYWTISRKTWMKVEQFVHIATILTGEDVKDISSGELPEHAPRTFRNQESMEFQIRPGLKIQWDLPI